MICGFITWSANSLFKGDSNSNQADACDIPAQANSSCHQTTLDQKGRDAVDNAPNHQTRTQITSHHNFTEPSAQAPASSTY